MHRCRRFPVISILQLMLIPSFLIFSLHSFSQNRSSKIDSLKNLLITQKDDTTKVKTLRLTGVNLVMMDDVKEGGSYIEQSIALADKINDAKGKQRAFVSLGVLYEDKTREFAKAIACFEQALAINKMLDSKDDIGKCYTYLGNVYGEMDNLPESQKNYYASLSNFELANDKKNLAYVYGEIGFVNAN